MDGELFAERLKAIGKFLEEAERLLDEVLGKDEEYQEITLTPQEESREELFELFTQALSALWEKEENTLKVPPSRWKTSGFQRIVNWEAVNLSDLLVLYGIYIEKNRSGKELFLDDSFEKLLAQRREEVRKKINSAPGRPLEMAFFFQDCQDSRSIIATFLVLLDLVFHKELHMIVENQGRISFIRNGENPVLKKSP